MVSDSHPNQRQQRSGRDAFETLYREMLPTVYRFTTARLGPTDGEDVAAEVFHAAAIAYRDGRRQQVTPAWLIVTYALHTTGELCISPIGLSAITKLSPEKRVGQMMGIWFVGAALGNLFAGLVAGRLADLSPAPLFQSVAMTVGVVGIVAVLASPFVRRLMKGVN